MPVRTRFGWKPDLPDHRDLMYQAPRAVLAALPTRYDVVANCPTEIFDQGQLGSCTANAIATAFQFDLIKQKAAQIVPSRLFIYFNEREKEGTVAFDSGAMIRDGIKSVKKQGVCPESMWLYSDKDPGPYQEKPASPLYAEARNHQVVSYQRIPQSLRAMKSCLASGYPFVFGFTVYESFMTAAVAATGEASMPGPNESVAGGHAVLAVGYDDTTQRFQVRNSWGADWGRGGYFTMPYAYLTDPGLANDFWTLRLVEG